MSEPHLIRRRHVFYVCGYDLQGAAGYYRLFVRELERFGRLWPVRTKLSELAIDSDELAHWNIGVAGPNWKVDVRYEFLRQEEFVHANMRVPIALQIPSILWWIVDDHLTGTFIRMARASWRFGMHILGAQLMFIAWLAVSVWAGWLAGWELAERFELPVWAATPLAVAVAIAVFLALRPLANRWFLTQIPNGWTHYRPYGRGEPTGFDRLIEAFAARLVEAARAGETDELLVVGHSAGGALALSVIERALELDPDLGRHGPLLVLLTTGSIMPGIAFHPRSKYLREVIRRLAIEPSLTWVDCQVWADICSFANFDPVSGLGIDAGAARCNPVVLPVHFRKQLSPETYASVRFKFFRMHYQYIMANDLRASYDYFLYCCGPAPIEDWARRAIETFACFGEDASFAPLAVTGKPGFVAPADGTLKPRDKTDFVSLREPR